MALQAQDTADTSAPGAQTVRLGYRVCRYIARTLFTFVFGGRVFGVQHVPRTGGVLLAGNHQSFLDPILLTLALPRESDYMARETLFDHAALKRVIEYFNAFAVRRDAADTAAIKASIRRLRAGRLIVTFPEGTRTYDGRIGPFRAGAALLARKTRVPIVPALVLGAFEAWPRGQAWIRPRRCVIAYDAPIYPHEHPSWSDAQCAAHVRERVVALQEHYRNMPYLRGRLRPLPPSEPPPIP